MDPLLQGALTKDLPVVEYLDVGIKASGKLQLLDTILSNIRNRGLRVVILFQVWGPVTFKLNLRIGLHKVMELSSV